MVGTWLVPFSEPTVTAGKPALLPNLRCVGNAGPRPMPSHRPDPLTLTALLGGNHGWLRKYCVPAPGSSSEECSWEWRPDFFRRVPRFDDPTISDHTQAPVMLQVSQNARSYGRLRRADRLLFPSITPPRSGRQLDFGLIFWAHCGNGVPVGAAPSPAEEFLPAPVPPNGVFFDHRAMIPIMAFAASSYFTSIRAIEAEYRTTSSFQAPSRCPPSAMR